jgi:C-methyltransferase C-terminal domain/Putative zinc binding domain/Methyltransferase domain
MADFLESANLRSRGRGAEFCRGCLGLSLFSALDLGEVPLANELALDPDSGFERYRLHLRICNECGLGQVEDAVLPDRIFRDYRYLSSMSTTFLDHARKFVQDQIKIQNFKDEDWVLELASNDGYLLKNFVENGIKVLGVEPAQNIATIARNTGINTISEFFTSSLAYDLKNQYGFPKLIIANNVMAHVPDLNDFVLGLSILCGNETQISVENPSLANIALGLQFDTIYHEHYSYLTAFAVQNISRKHGLNLFKVESIKTHGGSNRYWLNRAESIQESNLSVQQLVSQEVSLGLFDTSCWREIDLKVKEIQDEFFAWLKQAKESGLRVYGYGAAAKASTLINSINIESGMLLGIADISLEKQGRFMPPKSIEIISPQTLSQLKPTDVIIFPWNIKDEIVASLRASLDKEVRYWCPIPRMSEVVAK